MKSIPIGLRIALIISLTMTGILLVLNLVVTAQGNTTFVSTISAFQMEKFPAGIPGGVPASGTGPDILFVPQGGPITDVHKTPQDFFNQQFQSSLLWVTMLSIGVSLLLGLFIGSELISKPLRRLQVAINGLKQRKFTPELKLTGLPEFDQVIGEFNQLAGELDQAERLRRDLISDTSHELKTPLTALKGQLEGMRDGVISLNQERVGLLLNQVDRLDDLTDRLHEYASLRNRTARVKKSEIAVRAFLERMIIEYATLLKKARLETRLHVSEDLHILADAGLLEEVFSNLLGNAVRYSEGTEIVLTASEQELRFADNGKGVPQQALGHIFERFYRVDPSRNRKEGGLGLGLAIVREIVEAHGWQIDAQNIHPGLEVVIHLSNATAA